MAKKQTKAAVKETVVEQEVVDTIVEAPKVQVKREPVKLLNGRLKIEFIT